MTDSPDQIDLAAVRRHIDLARRHIELADELLARGSSAPVVSSDVTEEIPLSRERDVAQALWPDIRPAVIAHWLQAQPPVVVARLAGLAWLFASALVLWQQGDTLIARGVWVTAILVFVAVFAYQSPVPERRTVLLVVGAFLVSLIVRLAGIDHLALGIQGDESATALAARAVLSDGAAGLFHDRSFGVPAIGYLWFTPLIGTIPSPIAAVRATSAVAGAATVAMVVVWGLALGGPRLAIIAGALMGAMHTALYLSHLGTSNGVALLCATSALTLLTVTLVHHSWLAAVLTALALVGVWFTWAGAREVLPVVALGALVAWRGRDRLTSLGPFAVATGGAVLMLAGPALSVGVQSLPVFMFPRSDSALTAPGRWAQAAQMAGTNDTLGIMLFHIGRVLSAFPPSTFGDRSPFYHFGRPIVDLATLGLALIGCVTAIQLVRRRRVWLLPPLLVLVVLSTAVATAGQPDYPRLSPMLPAVALLAALPLAWIASQGKWPLLAVAYGITAIGLLNMWWFFAEYAREGEGAFEHVILVRLAQQGPVYVVTPNYYFVHETLALLDPQHRVQPPPPNPDPRATWAAIGPTAQDQLVAVRAQLPADTLQTYTDNAGRIVVYALTPP